MEVTVKAKFDFGDTVRMATDEDTTGKVVGFYLKPGNALMYEVQWGWETNLMVTEHYEFELEKQLVV